MSETLISKRAAVASLQDMRAHAAQKLAEAEEMQRTIDEDDRDWTPEEEAQHGSLLAEASDLRIEYEREQRRMQTEARRQSTASVRSDFNAIPNPQDALTRGAISRVTHLKANWTEDPQWGFHGLGDFAMAVHAQAVQGTRDERLERVAGYQAALDHNVPSAGGILMPPLHNMNIYNHMMGSRLNLMALCDRYPLTGPNNTIELTANAETSRVTGSRWGGVQSYWVEDGTAMTESQPKVRMLELRPRQLATMVKVTNTLLQSNAALEAFLDMAAVDDQIQTINNAILRGDGVGKPKGILTSGSLVTISKETSQAAATIVDDNIFKMWARVLGEDDPQTLWLVNRDTVPQVEGMAAGGVSGTIPVMLAQINGMPTMAMQAPSLLKGRPFRRCEQCSTVGTLGDIILANMGGYALSYRARTDGAIGDEPAITKDMSMHLEFDKNRTAFRFLISVDGQTWLQSAITPEQGTATMSHFIVIETRS